MAAQRQSNPKVPSHITPVNANDNLGPLATLESINGIWRRETVRCCDFSLLIGPLAALDAVDGASRPQADADDSLALQEPS